jgi:hypothetical protein
MLSDRLKQIMEENEGVTLNELLERTQGLGLHLVIILLALPFIIPVSIPGVSTVLGLAITFLSLRLALGRDGYLPKFVGDRRLTPGLQKKFLTGSIRFLRVVEKLVKPRRTPWMTTRLACFVNASLMAFMGILLALPFPPLPPLTNSLPSYSIILLAASMMEEDGVTIWIAYVVSGGTIIYLVVIVEVLEFVLRHAYQVGRQWLQ